MKTPARRLSRRFFSSGNGGFVAVTTALMMAGLLAFAALAIDVSSLLMVRNELQNAADAGALAATRSLYIWDGTAVDPGANAIGVAAATANNAQNSAVEVTADTANNTGDVQRGHWRWTDHSFTPNDSLAAVQLHEVSNQELDDNDDFINAVRVKVRRQSTPARAFLAQVFGLDSFEMQAEAVAYIGFAGSFLPGEADDPIVICREALLNSSGEYSCSTGRMINSGGGDTHNTGGWTNYTQGPCETASSSTVAPYVGCSASPSPEITLRQDTGTTGGQQQTNFDSFMDCWQATADSDGDGRADRVVNLTLPVISCPANNVGNCSELVGGVNVNLIWMIRQAQNNYDWVPTDMTGPSPFPDWHCPDSITGGATFPDLDESQRQACWEDFVVHFNLVNYAGTSINDLSPLSSLSKTLYFIPDCAVHVPIGVTAGPNLGVLAKVPVLVK